MNSRIPNKRRIQRRINVDNSESGLKFGLSESLIIAYVSLLSYLMVIGYYYEYFVYFLIPLEYFSIEISQLIMISLIVGVFVLGFMSLAIPFLRYTLKNSWVLGLTLFMVLIFFSTIIFAFVVLWPDWLVMGLLIFGSTCNLSFFWWYITKFSRKPSNQRGKGKLYKLVSQILNEFMVVYPFNKNTLRLAILIMVTLIFLDAAIFFGRIDAMRKTVFSVVNVKPQCALIYSTSEYGYCVEFNEEKREITGRYRIINFKENHELVYDKQRIGPLHLKPTPTPTPKPTLTPTVTKTPLPTSTPTGPLVPTVSH